MKSYQSDNKFLVGFFPLFYNLAETGRAVLIAKRIIELGGKILQGTYYLIDKIS
jgi:hypothetical protein